jgi:hypothetical protein
MYHRLWGFARSPRTSTRGARPLALATFLHLLRPRTLEEQRQQREYSAYVSAVSDRVRAIFDGWVALREIEGDYGRLANASAVNRWELMRLVKETEHVHAPRALQEIERDVGLAVIASARACQLLANGYRFGKSDAICDGQALLVEAVDDLENLVRAAETR